jgi:hypothetical protein
VGSSPSPATNNFLTVRLLLDTLEEMASFSKSEAIKYGWEEVKKNPKQLILAAVIAFIVPYIAQYVFQIPSILTQNFMGAGAEEPTPLAMILSLLGSLASIAASIYIGVGTVKFSLAYLHKKNPDYNVLFSATKDELIRYLLASFLYGLMVIAGFILLIIPGIIWSVKYGYFSYLTIDQKLAPTDAIKKSGQLTQGHKWNLFLLSLLLGLISLLGLLVLFVGVFAAMPIQWLAQAYVYNKLLNEAKK